MTDGILVWFCFLLKNQIEKYLQMQQFRPNPNVILITGDPGVGKTTIIKKLIDSIRTEDPPIPVTGFYTEEVRSKVDNSRIGFDVIRINNETRRILARDNNTSSATTYPKIGKYFVHINSFESLCLPILSTTDNSLLIIDEIGKMELLSTNFKQEMKKVIHRITRNDCRLIATIPNRKPPAIVEEMKNLQSAQLFTVTKTNRNDIFNDILTIVKRNCKK